MRFIHQCISFLLCLTVCAAQAHGTDVGPVYTSYHWHLQQPIYWPDKLPSNPLTYQKAWDSIQLAPTQGGHPENDLKSIFGSQDRTADYQHYCTDALSQCLDLPDMGAQVSYSGCLMENVASLAGRFQGYNAAWNETYCNWRADPSHQTSAGLPRLDFVSFTYHHALAGVVDNTALQMEIATHKVAYAKAWGTTLPYSSGFFPAETVFSERAIPALVAQGIEWVFVSNNHFSRACQKYPYSPTGDNINPPNRADQQNPAQPNYFKLQVDRGVTPNNAYPFSYRPHYAQYVDPDTGKVSKIIVVPTAQAMGWKDSESCYSTTDIQHIANSSDPEHPLLVVLAHDGDNDFSGGYSYYTQCVSGFSHMSGIHPTTVSTYLKQFPVEDNDVVHIEDGAWINKDGDFGSPEVVGWRWPLTQINGSTGEFDIPGGWGCNQRNWAVITAGQNFVETAEAALGGVRAEEVQAPTSAASEAELAWHFFLPSLTSGYMYYGTVLDMPVKQTIACNNAIAHAQKAIGDAAAPDKTPPSIWSAMRLPHNPGGLGMGSLYKWKLTPQPLSFYVWTYIFDVSGVAEATFHYREDADGRNPIEDIANEVYDPVSLGLSGVGAWQTVPMTARTFPKGNEDGVDFFVLPTAIADEYSVYLDASKGMVKNNTLYDYYISATDKAGNAKNSEIFHVYVGASDIELSE